RRRPGPRRAAKARARGRNASSRARNGGGRAWLEARKEASKSKPSLLSAWFPGKDSNLRSRIQSPLPYRLATRERDNKQYLGAWGQPVTSLRPQTFRPEMKAALVGLLLLFTVGCGGYRFPGDTPSPATGTVSGRV